jgi:serine/threonine-protein kinase HipA
VLNARRTGQKYSGSYETSVLKRFTQFANSSHMVEDLERLFTLLSINGAIRNGDAHLKNFGVVYDDVEGEARLAPVYDLVTTSVYLPKDSLALTLNGTTRWPTAKELQRLGETRMGCSPARTRQILERIAHAMRTIAAEIKVYNKEHPEFEDIGTRMMEHWELGIAASLQPA